MPGILQPHDGQPTTNSSSQKAYQSYDLSAAYSGRRAAYLTSGYPQREDSTPYGVNEPQWTRSLDPTNQPPLPMTFHLSPYARVPLPPMSNSPVNIEPILQYNPQPALIWSIDQPPSNAYCNPALGHRISPLWQAAPASIPPTLTSFVVRLYPLERPIVLTAWDGPITVGSVLTAVYNAVREAATAFLCRQSGVHLDDSLRRRLLAVEQMSVQGAGQPRGDDSVSTAVCSLLGYKTYWTGLCASSDERDVWILHTHRSAGG